MGIVQHDGEDSHAHRADSEQLQVLHQDAEDPLHIWGIEEGVEPQAEADAGDRDHLFERVLRRPRGDDREQYFPHELKQQGSEGQGGPEGHEGQVQVCRLPGRRHLPRTVVLPKAHVVEAGLRHEVRVARGHSEGDQGDDVRGEGKEEDDDELQVIVPVALDRRSRGQLDVLIWVSDEGIVPSAVFGMHAVHSLRARLEHGDNKDGREELHGQEHKRTEVRHDSGQQVRRLVGPRLLPVHIAAVDVPHSPIQRFRPTEESRQLEENDQRHDNHHFRPENQLLVHLEGELKVKHHNMVHDLGVLMHLLVPRDRRAEGEGQHLSGGHHQHERREQNLQRHQGPHLRIDLPLVSAFHVPHEGRPLLRAGDQGWAVVLVLDDFDVAHIGRVRHVQQVALVPGGKQQAGRAVRLDDEPPRRHSFRVPHLHGLVVPLQLHGKGCRGPGLVDVQHVALLEVHAQGLDLRRARLRLLHLLAGECFGVHEAVVRLHANDAVLQAPNRDMLPFLIVLRAGEDQGLPLVALLHLAALFFILFVDCPLLRDRRQAEVRFACHRALEQLVSLVHLRRFRLGLQHHDLMAVPTPQEDAVDGQCGPAHAIRLLVVCECRALDDLILVLQSVLLLDVHELQPCFSVDHIVFYGGKDCTLILHIVIVVLILCLCLFLVILGPVLAPAPAEKQGVHA
mmetsp:Transcript_92832/g.267012  ORF Transcript_92832/g.267012 Transcript_92832/m.267012 type:complete len:679 (-) Transcript_92832:696-2732(-)